MYRVFVRNWWKENPNWPNGLEPAPRARKHYLPGTRFETEDEASAFCQEYNRTHKPGRLSRKAEFEKVPQSRRGRNG